MECVKTGVIGLGNMGSHHARSLAEGKVAGAVLTAVCDPRPERLQWARNEFGTGIELFQSVDEFLERADMDGVLIATPHFSHPDIAIKAFDQGLHVLCEKPAGVETKSVRLMNEAAMKSGKVFSMMFNQRMNPVYQKVRDLILSGELGEIKRTNWIVTDWYRPQSYYNSGGWRATWAGEGGGVMLNQAPHQLDLWVWATGMMPVSVHAFCSFGRHREIEVEDEVTAYVKYANGASGLFVTSIAEAPGTNRLEVTGDRGKIVVENNELHFWRLRQPESEFNESCTAMFGQPECWKVDIPILGESPEHTGIMANWADAILTGAELVAPGQEGIHSLMVTNAVYLSAWLDERVELPINEELYSQLLEKKMNTSTFKGVDNHV
ncbi:Gfo/Idh/MocA family protein [Domibacillus enclensis]|uniref:Oxidoreductase n=1 Tax=Domibacillus enclensis TaxID=1017273 RepID=A0A1N6RH89_9BACI|nr:Gfo/Idh/MocA family oxidoreductase [Domibacillus enclensis]OXS79057.1 oxidoreductase [Domibacillus enclensis]SIQ28066.1 Predicted dehydrogenase [Domibacillus enclensis]